MGFFAGLARMALAVLPAMLPGFASADDPVSAISTPGVGVLTKCRDWIVFKSCNSYNNVALPKRIAIGDKVSLRYGSNPKDYVFEVANIRREGDSCKILSTVSSAAEDDENIAVAHCAPAT